MKCKEYSGRLNAQGLRFGLVVSRHNDLFTGQLLKGALDCLARHGADEKNIEIVWVPGAFEQPLAIRKLAQTGRFDALVALGAVVQGATPHAGLINAQVARALTQISLETGLPVADGVVAADNLDQAIERCGSKAGNRG
ncbi:MAG TPA: 6,7-dimethyl-8-ribityllumazine synthase, partial [Kiritimatiellia bacterium]|nr:6,7-dimethyl-8-ribityllumazine synthase [Kiritimatiellia bacterium]